MKNGRPIPDGSEPQLPAELQSLEAALSSLAPRRDRLDHDLVMYRAGQLSIRPAGEGDANETLGKPILVRDNVDLRSSAARREPRPLEFRRPAAGAFAWPAAFAAMTAAAATLLAMLLLQPQQQPIERVVYVPIAEVPPEPVERPSPGPADTAETDQDEPEAGRTELAQTPGMSVGRGAEGAGAKPAETSAFETADFLRGASRQGRAAELQHLERLLRNGADPWPRPLSTMAGGQWEADETPRRYREWLSSLLEGDSA